MSQLDQEEIFLFNGLIYQYLLDYPHEDLVGVTARELREHYGLSPKNSYKFSAVLCKYPRLFHLIDQERDGGAEGNGHTPHIRYYISLEEPTSRARRIAVSQVAR
jgi:hypothetical protein